ncbi:MAG: hypothetical protein ACRDD5_04175 [Silvania sp.]|uniref:hypothetical protein n=1 Tax=Silvania sp. TaxID=3016633 RepID=UPI003EE76EEA
MTSIPTLTCCHSDERVTDHSITLPLTVEADLFEIAARCAALVSVLIETDDSASRTALCEHLLRAAKAA